MALEGGRSVTSGSHLGVLQGATLGAMSEELPQQSLLPQHKGPIERPRRPRDPRYEAAVLSLLSTAAKKRRSSGPSAERLGPGASAVAAETQGERARLCKPAVPLRR